jgi:hypothetical protein
MEPFRIAIWNKNKAILAIASGIWVTTVCIAISGESPLLYPPGIPIDVV